MKILIVEDDTMQRGVYQSVIDSEADIVGIFAENKEEALRKIEEEDFDSAIVDLNLDSTSGNSEGNEVIKTIFKKMRIPVYVVSGNLSDYEQIDELENKELLLKKISRDEADVSLIVEEMKKFYETGITKLLNKNGVIEKFLREFYLNYSEKLVKELYKDSDSSPEEKEKIITRFCMVAINEKLRIEQEKYHPGEVYFIPPICTDISTGDIVLNKETNERKIILTPACDLVKRDGGIRNSCWTNLVKIDGVEEHYQELKDVGLYKNEIFNETGGRSKKFQATLQNLKDKKGKQFQIYLPKFDSIEEGIINLQHITTEKIEDIENPSKYERLASVNETFLRDIIAKFSSYYARQGSPEINY